MKIKDSELRAILGEVERELAALAKSEGATLRKAVGDEDPEGATPGPEGSAPAAEASAAPMPPEGSAGGDPGPEGSDPMAGPEMSGGEESGDQLDPEALKAEYAQLDPESLKIHYMACKAALFELMGGGGGASGPEASASQLPPGPGPEGSPAMKAEISDAPANGGSESAAVPDAIQKSEARIAELSEQINTLAKALELTLGTPVRKAVTGVSHIAKSEFGTAPREPSKDEIKEKIRTAMSSGKLTKSERDRIFSFTLGNVEFDEIKDLLDRR